MGNCGAKPREERGASDRDRDRQRELRLQEDEDRAIAAGIGASLGGAAVEAPAAVGDTWMGGGGALALPRLVGLPQSQLSQELVRAPGHASGSSRPRHQRHHARATGTACARAHGPEPRRRAPVEQGGQTVYDFDEAVSLSSDSDSDGGLPVAHVPGLPLVRSRARALRLAALRALAWPVCLTRACL